MDVMAIVNYVSERPEVLYPLVTLGAAFLPIPKNNPKLIAVRKLLDVLAGNFGFAKNKGAK
jgi:hypothetical protein